MRMLDIRKCIVVCICITMGIFAPNLARADSATLLVERARIRIAADMQYARGQTYYQRALSDEANAQQDFNEALKYFRSAADHGKIEALLMIASMYDEGRGVKKDDKEAIKLYQQAIDQSHELAKESLYTLYSEGKGVFPDYVGSYLKYNLEVLATNDQNK